MQDITAAEMIMIIDACHHRRLYRETVSNRARWAAVPGQLAYDKNMKILSATQADNVALELNSLETRSAFIRIDRKTESKTHSRILTKNKLLFDTEWLFLWGDACS